MLAVMSRRAAVAALAVVVAALAAATATAHRTTPALTILAPRSGATVTPPWRVRYVVTGRRVTSANPVRIQVAIVGLVGQTPVDLVAKHNTGTVRVPDNRFWSGRRDVVFTLVRSGGGAYTGSRASVTLKNLTIAGGRGG